jgi:hypothetical protein
MGKQVAKQRVVADENFERAPHWTFFEPFYGKLSVFNYYLKGLIPKILCDIGLEVAAHFIISLTSYQLLELLSLQNHCYPLLLPVLFFLLCQ